MMDSRTSTTTRTASLRQALPVEQIVHYYFVSATICDVEQYIRVILDHVIYGCKTICVVINDDSMLLTIMSRKNIIPGIAMYGIIGIWT